jgi:hypothetical protein
VFFYDNFFGLGGRFLGTYSIARHKGENVSPPWERKSCSRAVGFLQATGPVCVYSPVDSLFFDLGRKAAIQAMKTANHERRTKATSCVLVSVPSVPTKCIAVDNDSHFFTLAVVWCRPQYSAAEYIALAPKPPWIARRCSSRVREGLRGGIVENFPS